jgi:hypothetical protein
VRCARSLDGVMNQAAHNISLETGGRSGGVLEPEDRAHRWRWV